MTPGTPRCSAGLAGADLGPWYDTFTPAVPVGLRERIGDRDLHDRGLLHATSVAVPDRQCSRPVLLPGAQRRVDFYRAHRDGAHVDPSLLDRQPGHLNDRTASVYAMPHYDADDVLLRDLVKIGGPVNAEGGWFDAGDYVKFVGTTSFAESLMLLALRDHPSVVAGSRMRAEAKHGLAWLLKMWDDRRRILYFQVGIGSGNDSIAGDHDVWRLPQEDDGVTCGVLTGTCRTVPYSEPGRPGFAPPTVAGQVPERRLGTVRTGVWRHDRSGTGACVKVSTCWRRRSRTPSGGRSRPRPGTTTKDYMARRPRAGCGGALPRPAPGGGPRSGSPPAAPPVLPCRRRIGPTHTGDSRLGRCRYLQPVRRLRARTRGAVPRDAGVQLSQARDRSCRTTR